jgi:hypothetical protein
MGRRGEGKQRSRREGEVAGRPWPPAARKAGGYGDRGRRLGLGRKKWLDTMLESDALILRANPRRVAI